MTGDGMDSGDDDGEHNPRLNPANMNITFDHWGRIIKLDKDSKKTIDPYTKHSVKAVKSNKPPIIGETDAYKAARQHTEDCKHTHKLE